MLSAAALSVGGVFAALAVSACCLGPLVLFAVGVTGAWVSNLAALMPYQPLFAVLTFALVGAGFYRVYRKRKVQGCEGAETCPTPAANRFNKAALWGAAVLVAAGLAARYVAPFFY
ncbi:MAG: mercuric transporter MerT family protein [Alphaproteobacteria bacterium]